MTTRTPDTSRDNDGQCQTHWFELPANLAISVIYVERNKDSYL